MCFPMRPQNERLYFKKDGIMKLNSIIINFVAMLALAACGKSIDKQVYIPRDLQGMNLSDTASEYCFQRSISTRDIIVFWEKGFGPDVSKAPDYKGHKMTANLDNLLTQSQYFYDFFKDTLHFITPGSAADSLKMMIMLRYDDEGTAYGGDYDEKIGALWVTPLRTQDERMNCIAHELGHSFQSQLAIDNNSGFGGGGIYEMTSQWMLWQVNPLWVEDEEYHWDAFMKQTHLAFMHPENMYHSPYVLEYWSEKYGKQFIADLWRSARKRHDVVAVYEDMKGIDDAAFGQEMLDAARHFMTYDMPQVRSVMKPYANRHSSTLQPADEDGWQRIADDRVPQQYGYNGISLNVPDAGQTVTVSVKGVFNPGRTTYAESDEYVRNAAWSFGLVGVKQDGSCIYSETAVSTIGRNGTVSITAPLGEPLSYLWLVVVPTPSKHQDVLEENAADYVNYPYSIQIKE